MSLPFFLVLLLLSTSVFGFENYFYSTGRKINKNFVLEKVNQHKYEVQFRGLFFPIIMGSTNISKKSKKEQVLSSSGGSTVGNGGYVVLCPGKGHAYSGIFALDFIDKDRYAEIYFPHFFLSSHAEAYLFDKLSFYFSKMRAKRYLNFLRSYDHHSKKITWSKWNARLSFLPQKIYDKRRLPNNCDHTIQIIKRYEENEEIHFFVDAEILHEMKMYFPLQYSMIMFHEFLWSYTKDEAELIEFNYFFHSKSSNLSREDFLVEMRRNYPDIYHRMLQ